MAEQRYVARPTWIEEAGGMRIDRSDGEVVEVVLSRRNLETLLAKLSGHPPMSAATIVLQGNEEEKTLVVRGEADELHYGQRADPPGAMHPETEAAMRRRDRGDGWSLN